MTEVECAKPAQDSLDARGFKARGMFTTIEISRFDGLLDCFSNHTNPAIKIYSNTNKKRIVEIIHLGRIVLAMSLILLFFASSVSNIC